VCRLVLCACAMLISGCVYISDHTATGACLDDLSSPIRNFCVVVPGVLWRGERPTRADAKWLLEQRVGSVLSVQVDSLQSFEAVAPPQDFAHSVPYFQMRGFNPLQILTRSELDEHIALYLAIVQEAPKPIYVHCRAGVDRTGVLTAAYRVLIEGASAREAIAEMARFQSPWQRIDARYVRTISEHRTEILSQVEALRSRLRPDARITCSQGKCESSTVP